MSLLGIIIVISMIIALVFGWDFMVELWLDFFNFLGELADKILDRPESLI